MGNVEFDGGEHTAVAPGQSSVTVGAGKDSTAPVLDVAETTWSAGQEILGGKSPLSKIVIMLSPRSAMATSDFPSRLKSLTSTDAGPSPVPMGEPAVGLNPPVPSPKRIVTLAEYSFATAKSRLPSPLKSPAVTEAGLNPAATGEPAGSLKWPLPSPSRIVTSSELPLADSPFAVAKSR